MRFKIEEDKPLCIKEVNENIRRCELGMPLTRSLRVLNCNCDFKNKFDEMDKIMHPDLEVKAKRREYRQKYYQKPEVKAKQREYMRKKLNIKSENYKVQ